MLAKALLLSTSGSYHAPSQMAMMCSGMMSDKRTDQNFAPVIKDSHYVASYYAFWLWCHLRLSCAHLSVVSDHGAILVSLVRGLCTQI